MHTLARHQLMTPIAPRQHFGLGTVASPCGNPAYRNSPEGRAYCQREAESVRQAEAWAEVYRKLGITPTSVRPSDAELQVLARAASEIDDGVPAQGVNRQRLIPIAALALAIPTALFFLGRASGS